LIVENSNIKKVESEYGVFYWKITFNGKSMSLNKWAKFINVRKQTLKMRLERGWSIEEALGVKPRKGKPHPSEHFLTHNGQTHNLATWSKMLNFPGSVLKMRIYRGWSVEKALTTPTDSLKGKLYNCDGKEKTLTEWAKKTSLPRHILYLRIRNGWSVKRALATPVRIKNNGMIKKNIPILEARKKRFLVAKRAK